MLCICTGPNLVSLYLKLILHPSYYVEIITVLEMGILLEHLQQCSVRNGDKIFLHQSLVMYFFPTPLVNLKLALQIGGRVLIPTQMDETNSPPNQQQVLSFAVPLTSLYISFKKGRPRPFC
jgi:hypothetical protein